MGNGTIFLIIRLGYMMDTSMLHCFYWEAGSQVTGNENTSMHMACIVLVQSAALHKSFACCSLSVVTWAFL